MIPDAFVRAFKTDVRNGSTPERRRTILKIWTATICNEMRLPHGGFRALDIQTELEEVVKELGLTLGEPK
jgi:hypothetical protein